MRYAHAALALAVLPLPSLSLSARDKREPKRATYKVEFNLREGAQSAASAGLRYTMILEGKGHGTFHIGNRVPCLNPIATD